MILRNYKKIAIGRNVKMLKRVDLRPFVGDGYL